MKKQLIVILGPTGTGKTKLAIKIATQYSIAVFSADARQFYKEMEIGTAKPGLEKQQGILHYFINSHSIHNPYNAGMFEKEALAKPWQD